MEFGELVDVDARRAWQMEARVFTPWLAGNLDRLSAALGITLVLERAEARVGRYSADILARNALDGTAVLIENQLEPSDHTHLGQVLTYLTGLDAQSIVWVAPVFRDEHLSALRWLNENTVEPFAFFAVRLRVVQIGDSALAPLFEVVERPNNWDRRLHDVARQARQTSATGEAGQRRRAFWARYSSRFPDTANEAARGGGVSRWRPIPGTDLFVSQWFAPDNVGVFVRGGAGVDGPAILPRLAPFAAALQEALGVGLGGPQYPLLQRMDGDTADEATWDGLSDWLHERAIRYSDVLRQILRDEVREPRQDEA